MYMPCGLADTNAALRGRSSVRIARVGGSGPLLVTVIVYVRFCPTATGSGESVFVTDKSADRVTSAILATKASMPPLKVRSGPAVTGKVASEEAVRPMT